MTDVDRLDAGASVQLRGKLVPSRGAGQAREFLVQDTEIIGSCDPEVSPPPAITHYPNVHPSWAADGKLMS